jgi:hypothetical protein
MVVPVRAAFDSLLTMTHEGFLGLSGIMRSPRVAIPGMVVVAYFFFEVGRPVK